jgi:hypothetical protein
MTKCIVCAKRTIASVALTCIDCVEFLRTNGFVYSGESIESYTYSFAGILARPENAEFLAEITKRRQEQRQSVLDAIAMAVKA